MGYEKRSEGGTATKPARRTGEGKVRCRFCRTRVHEVDYKEIDTLGRMVSGQGKLYSRKRSGNCAKHQRSVKRAVMRARYLALLPYVGD